MAPEKGALNDSERDLLEFIKEGKCDEVKRVIQVPGVRVDCLDENGMTPLQHAAYKGSPDIAEVLLDHGADVNSNYHDHGYTALMFAAISGNTEVTRLMLQAGGSTGHVNSVGRTAAQMAGFVGQPECASLINNFFSKEDLEYYTVIRGHEEEPKLPRQLVSPLYKMILFNNLSPVFLSMYLQENTCLLDEAYKVSKVLDLLCEKVMKQSSTNEVMGMKFHYLACVIRYCEKSRQDNSDQTLDVLIKSLVRGRNPDGFPETQERLIRSTLKDFPYTECQLLQQMIRNIAPIKIGEGASALSILSSAINGQRFAADEAENCGTCGTTKAEKKCSACKMVKYCNQRCQKLHWATHKKFCKQLAEEYIQIEKRKKEEEEREKKAAEQKTKEAQNKGDGDTAETPVSTEPATDGGSPTPEH